ncbi:hypothetical protein [Metapseudomonas otitidis]|uniref:hypothetical protein n=1 Tax=Metapseudomonas otitidis TaxID=319939 RepID=UPI0013F5BCC7|nr:hypothetical protein [Pseudomonas otitidis]
MAVVLFKPPAAAPLCQRTAPACTVLTPELARKLAAVNAVSRSLREAGIQIASTVVMDLTILIEPESSDQLAAVFSKRWQGAHWSTHGLYTRNVVTIDGVRVAWFTPVKVQD